MSKKTDTSNELLDAMIQIAHLGKGPEKQTQVLAALSNGKNS